MSQHAIINKILNNLGIDDESKLYDTPKNGILTKNEDENGRKQYWHYHSVFIQMNYLAVTTRPDIPFTVHQCIKYSIYSKQTHKEDVKRIGHY